MERGDGLSLVGLCAGAGESDRDAVEALQARLNVKQKVAVKLVFFSSRRRHTILQGDWSSDVCSSDLSAARIGMDGCRNRRPDRTPVSPTVHPNAREDSRSIPKGTEIGAAARGAVSPRDLLDRKSVV